MADRTKNPSILSFNPDDFSGDEDPWSFTAPPLSKEAGSRAIAYQFRMDPTMAQVMDEIIAARLTPATRPAEFFRTAIWTYVVRFLGGSLARARLRIRDDIRRLRILQDEAARELRQSAVESLLGQRVEIIKRWERLDSPEAAGREWLRAQRIFSASLAGTFRDWGLRQLELRGDLAVARDAARKLRESGYEPTDEVGRVMAEEEVEES